VVFFITRLKKKQNARTNSWTIKREDGIWW
jgi:hypothetical protein